MKWQSCKLINYHFEFKYVTNMLPICYQSDSITINFEFYDVTISVTNNHKHELLWFLSSRHDWG